MHCPLYGVGCNVNTLEVYLSKFYGFLESLGALVSQYLKVYPSMFEDVLESLLVWIC